MKLHAALAALIAATVFLLSACSGAEGVNGVPEPGSSSQSNIDNGRRLIAGRLPNNEANLVQWIQTPQKIWPGNAMPDLGVSAAEVRDITAYLYHQPTVRDLLMP